MSIATDTRIDNISQTYFGDVQQDDNYFRLNSSFLQQYATKRPNFGFNGLGEFVFYRTYSRRIDPTHKETFLLSLKRTVEGCYEIQRRHCRRLHIPWDFDKAQDSAQEMFSRMWEFKFLPPGRGLWMMGTPFMWERGSAALNNCGFVSTYDQIESDPAEPFCFLMDMSMLGVGVGFDTKGADRIYVNKPISKKSTYIIADSREGWVDSVRHLIWSYTIRPESGYIDFDYSQIRSAGTRIKGFGGRASGPDILVELHDLLRSHLDKKIGKTLGSVDIVDLMNYIGRCVVAGNVRRTAEIAFGEADDHDYCSMKNPVSSLAPEDLPIWYEVIGKLYNEERYTATLDDFANELAVNTTNLQRIPAERLRPAIKTWNCLNHHRWASNNSIFAKVGMNYDKIAEQIAVNGEPGLMWLDNMRDYGRMIEGRQPGIDGRVMGGNPCLEQSLESYELCNLVETFPANHDHSDDYMRTLKFSYLYAKTVTLLPTHHARTNAVTLRNRRIGLSQSGIAQAFAKFGRRAMLRDFCDTGYNEIRRWDNVYAEWLCIQPSIKVTSVKPSGTVSLVAGATPGIHYPEASTYWRRVRVAKNSALAKILAKAGYHIEPMVGDEDRTVVITFAISDERVRPVDEISIWEQVQNVVDYQRYWADNQVSCTVKFRQDEIPQIKKVLESYEDQLKGISFLPLAEHGYVQAPYEPCTTEEVKNYNDALGLADYSSYVDEATGSNYCDNDSCTVNLQGN